MGSRERRYDSGGLELVRQYEMHPDEVPTTENLEVSHSISLEEAYAGGDYALGLSKQILCLSCRHQPRLAPLPTMPGLSG